MKAKRPEMSPTARSLAKLAAEGYTADVVERHISTMVTRDLFGFIDIIAINGPRTLAVQCTSYSNTPSRVNKIAASSLLDPVRAAGWRLVVWGWRDEADGRLREVVVLPGHNVGGWPEQMELPLSDAS